MIKPPTVPVTKIPRRQSPPVKNCPLMKNLTPAVRSEMEIARRIVFVQLMVMQV
jgi:hypothetical protein